MTAIRGFVSARSPAFLVVAGLGMAVAAAYLVGLGWAMEHASFDAWGGLVVAPALIAVTAPFAARAARRDADPMLFRIIMIALVLKLVGSLVRYFVAFELYGGSDATSYDVWGGQLAPLFRSGHFSVDIGRQVVGTGFIRILTGVVYTVTGPTRLGGFLVYSWLGFIGLFLFYRAFRIGFPQGDRRRYALLVFFLPSLLFWPSSIGKEAWMMLTLGLCAYGCARLLTRTRGGLPVLLLGLVGTGFVRPHVTLVVFVALFVGYLLRGTDRPSITSPFTKFFGIALLVVVGFVIVGQVETFFGVDRLDQQSVDQVLEGTEEQTSTGGSEFEAPGSPSVLGFPRAAVTVLFRPWPSEVGSGPTLLASLEGLLLLGIVAVSWRRLIAVPGEALRTPYVAFALTFSVLFIFAFANIANFGILARERVQLFPIFMVLLAAPPFRGGRERGGSRPPARQPQAVGSPGPPQARRI